MGIKIATLPRIEEAADVVVRIWEATKPRLLRFEGFDGVGKTGLARLVASRIGAKHMEGDVYAFKPEIERPYRDCLRRLDLDFAIESAATSGDPVVLDAVCLDEVAPASRWGRGFVVYVKRLSFNNPNPIWHHGFEIADAAPKDEPHRGIVLYHQNFKPHETCDLIVELPDQGHKIWRLPFDRSFCFDPNGAKVLEFRSHD